VLPVIGFEKVAVTDVVAATPVAPDVGEVEVTVGGAGSVVVKDHVFGAVMASPEELVAVTVDV
jgi:hypothetical protein